LNKDLLGGFETTSYSPECVEGAFSEVLLWDRCIRSQLREQTELLHPGQIVPHGPHLRDLPVRKTEPMDVVH